MPDRKSIAAIAILGAGVAAMAIGHAYRWYRWVAYGEPLPS